MEGRCTCGEIRFRLTSDPLVVHCCHCTWCQRETGSAFVLNAMIETDRVELLAGAPEVVDTPSNSGFGQRIARCPTCRVALWSNYGKNKADILRFVRVGTLEPGHGLEPDAHVFTSSKVPWVVIPDDQRAFEEFYRREEVWAPDKLERRRAALDAASG